VQLRRLAFVQLIDGDGWWELPQPSFVVATWAILLMEYQTAANGLWQHWFDKAADFGNVLEEMVERDVDGAGTFRTAA